MQMKCVFINLNDRDDAMRLHRSFAYIILSFIYLLFMGCSSGGDSTPAATTDINIAGVWTIQETDKDAPSCNEVDLDRFDLTVTQNGSSVTITDVDGNSFPGTLNDHTLSWSGSFPQDSPFTLTAGITTISSMTATIDASCNSLTGNASWTWTSTEGPAFTCSGTTTFTGTRDPAIGCGTTTSGTPTGVWEGRFTETGTGLFTDVAGIVQGDQIRLISDSNTEASAGTITVSGGSFTASMADYDSGVANGFTTSLTGTFTAGSAMSGTFDVSDGATGSFSLTYDPVTDKGSSLAATTGTWTNGGLTLTISSAGAVTGSDIDSCNYIGSIGIIDSAVNIYSASVTVSCPGGIGDGTYNGYAVISDTSGLTNNTLNVVVHNASFLVSGALTK